MDVEAITALETIFELGEIAGPDPPNTGRAQIVRHENPNTKEISGFQLGESRCLIAGWVRGCPSHDNSRVALP